MFRFWSWIKWSIFATNFCVWIDLSVSFMRNLWTGTTTENNTKNVVKEVSYNSRFISCINADLQNPLSSVSTNWSAVSRLPPVEWRRKIRYVFLRKNLGGLPGYKDKIVMCPSQTCAVGLHTSQSKDRTRLACNWINHEHGRQTFQNLTKHERAGGKLKDDVDLIYARATMSERHSESDMTLRKTYTRSKPLPRSPTLLAREIPMPLNSPLDLGVSGEGLPTRRERANIQVRRDRESARAPK